jgi:nicotinate-nucleotide pyrophosphorylase
MSRSAVSTAGVRGALSPLGNAGQMKKLASDVVRRALEEDIGPGDVSSAIFPPAEKGSAEFLAKQSGVLSGTMLVNEVFRQLSPAVRVRWKVRDGESFHNRDVLGTVEGPFASLLQGERLALNFIQQMSGIASLTRLFVDAAGKSQVGIYDTRKTTPLLRAFEKQAVVHGGGKSNRFALYDMAMLKNNHLDAAGGVEDAVQRLEQSGFFRLKPPRLLCIEARDLQEALDAVENRADIIILDNMEPAEIRGVVAKLRARARQLKREMPQIEVSGGINLLTIKSYAKLPIDRISLGAITHSAPALDIALHFKK